MAASLCPPRTPPGRRAAHWLGLVRVGGAGVPRPTPNKSPSPACARRRAGRARESAARDAERQRERKQQQAVLAIKEKYGKNAILKGMNLEEGATQRERNKQVGGHRA